MSDRVLVLGAQLLILCVVLGLWELAASRYWIDPILTSKPTVVWATLVKLVGVISALLYLSTVSLTLLKQFPA